MKVWKNYIETMQDVVQKIYDTQGEAIEKAAALLADTTQKKGLIYGLGVCHSHLVTDAAFPEIISYRRMLRYVQRKRYSRDCDYCCGIQQFLEMQAQGRCETKECCGYSAG